MHRGPHNDGISLIRRLRSLSLTHGGGDCNDNEASLMFEPPEQSICYGNPIGPSGSIACADKPYMQAMLSFHYVWINLGHAVDCLMHLGLHHLQTPKTLRSS